MQIKKISMGGLKPTQITPVPGVVSPTQSNTASPNKVGSQAVVKTPKAKKLGDGFGKPSVEFGKSEQNQVFKKRSIQNLHNFLSKVKSKKR